MKYSASIGSITHSNLEKGTHYSYRALFYDYTGRLIREDTQEDIALDSTPPVCIASLTATSAAGSSDSIHLSWEEPIDTDFTHVELWYTPNDGSPVSPDGDTTGALQILPNPVKGTTTMQHTHLIAGQTYDYAAFAFDGASNYCLLGNASTTTGIDFNPTLSIPATINWDATPADSVLDGSDFTLGSGGCAASDANQRCDVADGNDSFFVALTAYNINTYEVTNQFFQQNFFDLDGDGNLLESSLEGCSAYFYEDCVGNGGITALQAWEAALTGTGRTVTIHSIEGVSFSQGSGDFNDSSIYTQIKGPGNHLNNPTETYWLASSEPWLHPTYANFSDSRIKPVVFVSWYEARAFCKFTYGINADLLTEAQWERATKKDTSILHPYSWGTSSPTCTPNGNVEAVYSTCNCHGMCSVGEQVSVLCPDTTNQYAIQLVSNEFGLFNMAGNVREWVRDWKSNTFYGSGTWGTDWNKGYEPYNSTKTGSPDRVIRGGSYSTSLNYLVSAFRDGLPPNNRSAEVGFRCFIP